MKSPSQVRWLHKPYRWSAYALPGGRFFWGIEKAVSDDAIPEDNKRPESWAVQKPFRPHLVPETGGALQDGRQDQAKDGGQAKSQDNTEIWISSSGRVAIQKSEKAMNESAGQQQAKNPVNGSLEILKLVGWVIFFGLLVSTCAISVVVPYKLVTGAMGW